MQVELQYLEASLAGTWIEKVWMDMDHLQFSGNSPVFNDDSYI